MSKYFILSLLAGVLFAISWPTYGLPFFLWFAFVPLLLLQHDVQNFAKIKRKGNTVFLLSFLSFVIWNTVSTGWLYGSLNPDGSHSLAAVILPIVLNSLLMGFVFWTYHFYKTRRGTYWGLAWLVASWMAFEKLHLSWELSWPWLNLGNAFSEFPKLIQWYDTLGATGGSFWIILANVYAFYTIRIFQAGRKRKALLKNLAILAGWILLPIGISLLQYYTFTSKSVGKVNVVLIQPALDPYSEKYQKDSIQILSDLIGTAKVPSSIRPTYFIAPETALPGRGSFSENGLSNSFILKNVENFLTQYPGAVFLSGISSHSMSPSGEVTPYNSSIQLAPNQTSVQSIYHKGKLVPAVEIFPYISLLKPILGNIMLNMGGSTNSLGVSTERKVFPHPKKVAIAAPIICYESIYGEYVNDYVKKGANFLAIMTNDSWWGRTEGHRQLLSYARLRAIETRREIARAANSGISAHIDAKGDIVQETFYSEQTNLPIAVNLHTEISSYVKYGDFINRICVIILGFLIAYPFMRKYLHRSK